MLILLPPSEGKTAPEGGPDLDLAALDFPALAATRAAVLERLVALCRNDATSAIGVLGLGPTQAAEVARNAELPRAACAPAIEVYTGVLYEALDATTLTPAARRRLTANVAIASALFGLVRPADPIPAYRLSGDASLPELGALAGVWRPGITAVLEDTAGPLVDLRSGAYERLGPLPSSAAHRSVAGRVLLERDGRRSVVSHHNKATKGRLVRDLVSRGPMPRSINGLLRALGDLGYLVELHESRRAGQPARLDIIVPDLR